MQIWLILKPPSPTPEASTTSTPTSKASPTPTSEAAPTPPAPAAGCGTEPGHVPSVPALVALPRRLPALPALVEVLGEGGGSDSQIKLQHVLRHLLQNNERGGLNSTEYQRGFGNNDLT